MHSLAQPSDDGRMPIDEITNPESYSLLCSQLRAATEKRASQLSKSVMNDLERRLLQRQQSGWFETFLVALILLNCVERACWLFRSWDDDTFTQRWPLDKRPPYYSNQGDRFSDILHMLLKMRSLPPKATPRPDTGFLKAVDGSDENAVRWFEMVQVSRKLPFPHLSQCMLTFQPSILNNDKLPCSIQMTRGHLICGMGRNCCRRLIFMHDVVTVFS